MSDKPPIERFYDSLAEDYTARKVSSVAGRIALEVNMEVITTLPLGRGPWRILDAGGGGGLYACRLAGLGHEVCVVDLSAGMLEQARRLAAQEGVLERITFCKANVCDLGDLPSSEPFDLVLAIGDVLSYCDDAEVALAEFARLVRPGGMLLAEVECRFGGLRTGRRGRKWSEIYRTLTEGLAHPPGWPDVAVRMFEPQEFRDLLQRTGWRIVHQWPGALCWALLGPRILQRVGRHRRGFEQLVALEKRLRKIPELLGAGGDLQVLASR